MASRRVRICIGMAAGLIWSVGLLWGAAQFVRLPVFVAIPTIMTAFFAPGLVMLVMIGRLAQRRFFADSLIDGAAYAPGSAADIDQRVLTNTFEQLVLALCIWPGAAILLADKGPGVIMALGLGFVIARLAFWAGYHKSPPLRAFGFAATFYPTVLVALWALLQLVTLGR